MFANREIEALQRRKRDLLVLSEVNRRALVEHGEHWLARTRWVESIVTSGRQLQSWAAWVLPVLELWPGPPADTRWGRFWRKGLSLLRTAQAGWHWLEQSMR